MRAPICLHEPQKKSTVSRTNDFRPSRHTIYNYSQLMHRQQICMYLELGRALKMTCEPGSRPVRRPPQTCSRDRGSQPQSRAEPLKSRLDDVGAHKRIRLCATHIRTSSAAQGSASLVGSANIATRGDAT
ncbi:hypothetical protein V9T40_007360 [Parthenolecanium corni]|uniref:Uncharacterized protein n=1 Tax=Parthenolecanium corni TaxID=536013 RepID=A0AAN9TXA0_9HEMI